MTGIKSNKIADLYHWFKNNLWGLPSDRERTAVADEVFLRLLDLPKDQRVIKATERISETGIVKLIKAQKRLNQGEPVQYITGISTFLDHAIRVKPGILIPRPETEGLVLWVEEVIRKEKERHAEHPGSGKKTPTQTAGSEEKAGDILDIGTGSGCIAIALAAKLPEYQVSACDIDQNILEVAQNNAQQNNVLINFFLADILQDTQPPSACDVDVIVSNPPYVRQLEKAGLQKQVRAFEPAGALFVPDEDPLLFYRAICAFARTALRPGGWLFFEINEVMGEACVALMKLHGFQDVELSHDFHGKDRYVAGRSIQPKDGKDHLG